MDGRKGREGERKLVRREAGREGMQWVMNALKDPARTSTEGERGAQNHAFGALLSHPQYCHGHH